MRSIASIGRTTVLLALLTCASTREAGADWLITPFVGATFAGDTTFLDLDQAASTKTFVYGVSGSWLSDRVFGVEAEFAHAPAFFETDGNTLPNVVSSSNMLTVSGNVIAAVPLSVTRESLRPYVTGGVGLLHASLTGIGAIFSEDGDLFAMNFGGGAIGLVSRRAGLRFDLRHFRSFSRGEDVFSGERSSKLRFWRATVGVVIRY